MTSKDEIKVHEEVLPHHCAGNDHGNLVGVIGEALDELAAKSRTIGVSTVGCSFMIYDFIDVDFVSAPAGLAPAVATGLKRTHPDRLVFTVQGESDVSGPGMSPLLDAVMRDEPVTIVVVLGTGEGSTPAKKGGPAEPVLAMARSLKTPLLLKRVKLVTDRDRKAARAALIECFQHTMEKKSLAILEVFSPSPTAWSLGPDEALRFQQKDPTRRGRPERPRRKKG